MFDFIFNQSFETYYWIGGGMVVVALICHVIAAILRR